MNKHFANISANPYQAVESVDAPVDEGEEIELLKQRVHNTATKAKGLDVGQEPSFQPAKPKLISQMRVDAQDPKPPLSSARKNAVAADLTGYRRDVPDRATISQGSPVRRSSTRTASSRTIIKRQKSPSPSLYVFAFVLHVHITNLDKALSTPVRRSIHSLMN